MFILYKDGQRHGTGAWHTSWAAAEFLECEFPSIKWEECGPEAWWGWLPGGTLVGVCTDTILHPDGKVG